MSRLSIRALAVHVFLGLLATAATAAAQSPTLTYPVNGAINANLTLPLQWTSVPNAQVYYLYLGTSLGAKDVINSGEIQALSYLAPGSTPVNQTLYARMFAKVGGLWYASDSTFTAAAPLTATMTSPTNGATNVNLALPITWTSVPNAQAYYLYVGTAIGTKNVINTGEIQTLSYLAPNNVPINQLLYARIHVKVNGVWRYADSTFTATTPTVVTSNFTYPTNGATNVNLLTPMQWTVVPNVQAYYLYVGTASGLKDVINSGEIHTVSYQAPPTVPVNQTLYARIYAKVDNVWRFTEMTFTAAPAGPTLTYPPNGMTTADLTHLIQWTAVSGAQAYYLYVGTSLGAKNIINTGEIQALSWQAASTVPINQLLYARIHAKVNGVWCYRDSTFIATVASNAVLTTSLTYPTNGATNVNLLLPITWASVPNAQAYYLYLGTVPGEKDVINSGETQLTSWLAPGNAQADLVLYARIHVKINNVWRFTDSSFTVTSMASALTYPANGATDVDRSRLITWNAVQGAQAYYLYVGSGLGQKDLIDTHETTSISASMANLPIGQLLYARLWTKFGGYWVSRDTTFTAMPIAPEFVAPADGAVNVPAGTLFQWTASIGAQSYRLYIGSSPGANDTADSGEQSGLSFTPTGLPASGTLYARVWAKVGGVWARHSDIAFTRGTGPSPSTIIIPLNGATNVDTVQPFEWEDVDLARVYRLTIGTLPNCNQLHDSGEVHVTQRFVSGLPTGTPLCGTVQTKIGGQWQTSSFSFTVTANHVSPVAKLKAALWATDAVRAMASTDNRPFAWAPLVQDIGPRYLAASPDFSAALLRALDEVNGGVSVRLLQVSFNATSADTHTLVEVFDTSSWRWLLLDPTIDVTVKRLDGSGATAEDVSQATNTLNWPGVEYVFLGPEEDGFAHQLYLDYPLFFANVYHAGDPFVTGQGNSVTPFLQSAVPPVSGPPNEYVVRCTAASTTLLVIDGNLTTLTCDGVSTTSSAFRASTITVPQDAPAFDLFGVQRFVF